jgi:hypothetical protein
VERCFYHPVQVPHVYEILQSYMATFHLCCVSIHVSLSSIWQYKHRSITVLYSSWVSLIWIRPSIKKGQMYFPCIILYNSVFLCMLHQWWSFLDPLLFSCNTRVCRSGCISVLCIAGGCSQVSATSTTHHVIMEKHHTQQPRISTDMSVMKHIWNYILNSFY